MTLRRQFLVVGVAVLLAALLVSSLVLRLGTRAPAGARLAEGIGQSVPVARELVEVWQDPDLQDAAERLYDLLGYRTAFIAPNGAILAESPAPAAPPAVANQSDNPEVRQALAGEVGIVERRSATVGERMVYAAELVQVSGEPLILRLATPAAPVGSAFQRGLWILGASLLAGMVLLWLSGRAIEDRFRTTLTDLTGRVRSMSQGEFAGRPSRSEYPPDLGEMAGALHDLAEQLEDRFTELGGERDEMQALIDSIAEGVIALTDDARVLRMNPAAAALLDIPQPPLFAPIGTLVRSPDLRDHLEESVIMPLPSKEFKLGERNLLVSSHIMAEGGAVVTLLDVTELRRVEQVRRDFVANASHELKTPLTAMRGFAETLLEGEPPPGIREEFLESIRDNTLRLQHLVDDLLDLSRLESGSWKAIEEEVDLAESARSAWEELGEDRRHEDVRFAVKGDGVALADSQALHQIFRNLFDNALRYTSEGGHIEVLIEPEGPFVRTAVVDSGSGIPSSALPRIFERFYRVDAARDRAAGGTGLGLAIVRHLVQSMGGRVGAESQLGKGTTIHFTLPRVAGDVG